MAVIHGIGGIVTAIVSGIVRVLDIVVSCLTCNTCGSGSRSGGRLRRRHRMGTTTGAATTGTAMGGGRRRGLGGGGLFGGRRGRRHAPVAAAY